jgi:acetyl-CoA carboxylase biotin carboxyl carrier protein
MDLTYDDVQKILRIVDGSSLEELHLESGDFTLVVRKRGAGPHAVQAPSVAEGEAATAETIPRPKVAPVPAASPRAEMRRSPASGVEVKAPMVGTFYRAPTPGAPPFVEVGSAVTEDDTVCIIEVMKRMNSIRAGCRGRVEEVCAENGTLVEFGQPLMVIEPLP